MLDNWSNEQQVARKDSKMARLLSRVQVFFVRSASESMRVMTDGNVSILSVPRKSSLPTKYSNTFSTAYRVAGKPVQITVAAVQQADEHTRTGTSGPGSKCPNGMG
jgi:hypothetical protein